MPLSDIVEVVITRENRSVTQKGFGTLLVVGSTDKGDGFRVGEFGSMDEVATRYDEADSEYQMAQIAFGGDVKPDQILIGYQDKTSTAPTAGYATGDLETDLTTWQAVADGSIGVTVDGGSLQDITGLDFSTITDVAEVADVIQASVSDCTVTSDGTTITFTSNTTGSTSTVVLSAGSGGTDLLASLITNINAVGGTDGKQPETITEALDAIVAENDDFYAVAIESAEDAEILELASWIQGRKKICFVRSNDVGILGTGDTDIASQLLLGEYDRTSIIYSEFADAEYIDSGYAGQYLPYDVGTLNWAFKSISGATANKLTSAEENNALDKNCNVYVNKGGRNVTRNGYTSGKGTYIDVIRSIDWLEARIQESVYGLLVGTLKVPYNDAGFAMVAGEVERVLQTATEQGIINPDWTVSVPKRIDADPIDVANRHFKGIEFTATLAGAINTVSIRGYLA